MYSSQSVGIGWAFLLNGIFLREPFLLSMSFFRLAELADPSAQCASHLGWISGRSAVRAWRSVPTFSAILLMLFLIGTFGLNFPIFISTMAVNVFHVRCARLRPALLHHGRRHSCVVRCLLPASQTSHPGRVCCSSGAAVFGFGCASGLVWLPATGGSQSLSPSSVRPPWSFTNGTNSIMQLSTEPAMRGRVMALRVGVALGGTPIGAPIVGWVANHFGPRWSLGIGAAAGFAAALVAAGVLAWRKETRLAE